MNRQQRRAQAQEKETRIEVIDLNTITLPWQMTIRDCVIMAQDRVQLNYVQTRHPYHHLTESGVIVEPDPLLEFYLKRIATDSAYTDWLTNFSGQMNALISRTSDDIPQAVPVNRHYYGHDPLEGH